MSELQEIPLTLDSKYAIMRLELLGAVHLATMPSTFTTTQEVAQALRGKHRITVITKALNVASILASDAEITLTLLGDLGRQTELSMIGLLTDQAIKEVRADEIIIAIHAIHPQHSLTNEYFQETLTDW